VIGGGIVSHKGRNADKDEAAAAALALVAGFGGLT
jgi:hypothetical protein